MCILPLILLIIFYFIKTKYIFQGGFDYFNQISAELHYSRLCSLLQNSPIFDLRGQTCTETDLRYRRGGNFDLCFAYPRCNLKLTAKKAMIYQRALFRHKNRAVKTQSSYCPVTVILFGELFFVVVVTAVVAVAVVKVEIKLCAAVRALCRAVLNGSAVEIYCLAA